MKCQICNILEADKTGSHMIPHFILESMLNETGVTGRDKGISYKLTETSSDFRFGRAMTPENLELQLGRQATNEEIENSVNEQYHVENYVFCTSCETKLSHFESLYKSEIDKSIKDQKEFSPAQLKIFQFFWLSVILRCSGSKFSNFKIEQELETRMRAVVNCILANSPKEIETNCLNTSFSFKLQVFTNAKTHDKTRNSVLLHPVYKRPYLLFINEYILLFDFTNISQIDELERHLKIHSKQEDNPSGLIYVNEDDWENVIYYCLAVKAKQMYKNNVERFQKSYLEKHSKLPPISVTKSYMDELTSEDDSIDEATKYSEERIRELTEVYISK